MRGYTSLTIDARPARAARHRGGVFTKGEFDAPVPHGNYGVKLAYRRSVARDWLVLETRVSCTFPREHA